MTIEKNSSTWNKFTKLSHNTPAVLGVLALGAGITMPNDAQAALVLSDIDTTFTSGNKTVNLDGEGAPAYFNIDPDMDSDEAIVYNKGAISFSVSNDKYANMFSEDDNINASWFDGTNGQNSNYATIYNGGSGPWSTIGASGFLGFRIAQNLWSEELSPLSPRVMGISSLTEVPNVQELDFLPPQIEYRYGFLEIERGSLILGQLGLQSTAGPGVKIPTAVSAPGSMALLASGAFGLLALRRRNKNKLEQKSH